jgi:hypothetical protein
MANNNAITPSAAKITVGERGLKLTNLEDLTNLARLLMQSGFVPSSYRGIGDVLAAMSYGQELGMSPVQATQSLAIVNGRPCLWGDGMIALVRRSPVCEWIHEEIVDKRTAAAVDITAVCRAKRKGDDHIHERRFSYEDAMRAELTGKPTWKKHMPRMLQMRARSWCLRDVFADVLCGLQMGEEVQDYSELTVQPASKVRVSELEAMLDETQEAVETVAAETLDTAEAHFGQATEVDG